MIGKMWIAMMAGAFMLVGGLATAAGSMSGDCDQTQDRLQLKDGSCLNETLESADASGGMNGDCLLNQTQDKLQLKDGSCQDVPEVLSVLAMSGDYLQNQTQDQIKLQDGSCNDCPNLILAAEDGTYHFWSFYYAELQDGETPYLWQSRCMCAPA